ncbi:MAG TPA: hypothetical protein VFL85_01610 [Candidatus Saccharimonadales bacterium]|nr:hypothetical protein [Candidatus Saccharimonadales bacterium]
MKLTLELERPIAFYPALARALHSTSEAIYLQQLIFWSDKGHREDGFIYKTKDEIANETTIPIRTQDRIRKRLETAGIITTKLVKANGTPTLHYRVNIAALQRLIDAFPIGQNDRFQRAKMADSITETTTETTTTNTTNVVLEATPPESENFNVQDFTQKAIEADDILLNSSLQPHPGSAPPLSYGDPDVAGIVEEFETVFQLKLKRIRQQRFAAKRLLGRYGNKVKGGIRAAAAVRDDKYAPQILNLEDLWEKWDKLEAYYRKKRKEQQSNVTIIEG